MTLGQQLALHQLEEIQHADSYLVEILEVKRPAIPDQGLWVEISLHCGSLPKVNGGLPLRERERFWLGIPARFPFTKPDIVTPHTRFAGWPHVQWKTNLCLYQAPDTEWDSSDGMFGFMDRLWVWLRHGALNELNPTGLPLHPPVTYTGGSSKHILVPYANTPIFGNSVYIGWAQLHRVTEWRFDLVGWHDILTQQSPQPPTAPAILLAKVLPWEMPSKLDDLLREFEACGISREALIAVLRLSAINNPKDQPLFFIVGTPQRGIAGNPDPRQHLMAWEVHPSMMEAVRLSLEKYSDYQPLRDVGERAEKLALDFAQIVQVNWCRVMENRTEVTIRRDIDSPVSVFRRRSVCLWGCGALGSHVAYCLVKAGVKKLVLVDRGAVTPGLLVRQMYEDQEIGQPKAEALRTRLLKLRPDLIVEAFTHDLLSDLEVSADWTHGADFLLDSTASHNVQARLELALRMSAPRRIPLVSMMVGPRAERGIIVVVPSNYTGGIKDVFRKAKIWACQNPDLVTYSNDFYPRGDAIALFQPEPGCSDATFIGSATDVCGLSASMLNLASQELAGLGDEAVAFFVAQPKVVTSKIDERPLIRGAWPADITFDMDYQVRLSLPAWKAILAEIRRNRRTRGKSVETGGILFGKRDDTLRIVWADFAVGPPPDSRHSATEFTCGVEGVAQMHESLKEQTRGSVGFIGMWHTHPEDVPLPSTQDVRGMVKVLTLGNPPPKKCLLVIVGLTTNQPVLGAGMFERQITPSGLEFIETTVQTRTLDREKL